MKKTLLILLSVILFSCTSKKIEKKIGTNLQTQINKITEGKNATVAVSINSLEENFNLNINGDKKLPLLSVFKFHVALAVLKQVDEEKLSLDQKILITKADLHENTYSPFRDEFPEGNVEKSLSELLQYMVSKSDNNITDVLLKLIGGPQVVQKFMVYSNIKNINIEADEAKMHEGWENLYLNTSSTNSLNDALIKFYKGKILSAKSTAFLMKTMLDTKTGANKIAANLPINIPVAHRTGSSGKNEFGLTAAENDIGIITLPNGKHFAISVLISDSMESEEINTRMIADISRTAFDYLNEK